MSHLDQKFAASDPAMKRTVAQAGFPADSHLVVEVHVPPDRCTRGEAMSFLLNCHSSYTVDHVKKMLQNRVKDATGRRPQLLLSLYTSAFCIVMAWG